MDRTGYRYGPHRCQVGDLWLPPHASSPVPVVVLIHGGFWRGLVNKRVMHRLAAAITTRGWAVWNIEYRRVGNGGGGWPNTFEDVAGAVDYLAGIDAVDLDRVITCGHSAGGHLASWLAAQGRVVSPECGPLTAPREVRVTGAIALAGVSDLAMAIELGLGHTAAVDLLGGSTASVSARIGAVSPVAMLPLGVPQVLVHGLNDQVVPPQMSEDYVRRATAAGDSATYVPLPGLSHRDLIKAPSPAWDAIAEQMTALIG